MNEKNFEYLKDQVKYTGFGEAIENDLKEKLKLQSDSFTLRHDAFYGNDRAAAELNFKKSDNSNMYFFNSYKLELQKDTSNEVLQQTFYVNKGSTITMKEAYNLMDGRAVNKDLTNKEGNHYAAWIQIDFKNVDNAGNFKLKQYHQNYGFDLENALSKHPIKELETPKYKEDLINSLKKGNLQSVTFLKDGVEQKHFIEANPQFKAITVYDSKMQRVDTGLTKKEKESFEEKHSNSQNVKTQKTESNDQPEIPSEKKKRTKKLSM